jgi:hypothetical protein
MMSAMDSSYVLNDQQATALDALKQADAIYHRADEHRTQLLKLASRLDIPRLVIAEAIGLIEP